MVPVPETAIRDTVDAVFSAAEFNHDTPLDRFWAWIGEQFQSLWDAIATALGTAAKFSLLYWLSIAAILIIALAITARVGLQFYAQRAGRLALGARAGASGRSWSGVDSWRLAQERAAAGDYTEAAHALYQAFIEAAAHRNHVRVHPSKTVGDYARELRRHRSSLLSTFREFARSYEVVIYGIGACDQERYERLRTLATSAVPLRG